MECVSDATAAGFWSRRLEEGGSPSADDPSLNADLSGKGIRRGPGPGPGPPPPYTGSYRKFVNHLVRSNFSDNLHDDSSFVGVDADAPRPRATVLDRVLDDVLAEERGESPRPLRPPRPPPRLGHHRSRGPGRGRGSSSGALWSGWAPSLTSISATAPLCLCLSAGGEQQTPPTPPPTPERPPRLAPRRPAGPAAPPAPPAPPARPLRPPQRPPRAPPRQSGTARGGCRDAQDSAVAGPAAAQTLQPDPPQLTDLADLAGTAPQGDPLRLTDTSSSSGAPQDDPLRLTDTSSSSGAPQHDPLRLTDTSSSSAAPQDDPLRPPEDDPASRRVSSSSSGSSGSSGSDRRRRIGVVAMLDEKLEMPSSLAPPLTAPWPAGVSRTRNAPGPGSTASDEGCSPRCSPRCSPQSSPSPSPSPTGEEEAWRWPDKQDSRARCCSSDSAIALPEQDNDSEDDGAQPWPAHGVCSRKCSVDDAADDADDDIPAGSDASCQGDKRGAAAKDAAGDDGDGAFDDTWRSSNPLSQLCLAGVGLKGLSLDDVRWSRFTGQQGAAGPDEDAEVEALVADGCDERGRRVKVFSFDSYDSGVSVSALRRASTQSTGALEDDAHPPYRYWRTPSVVVSDYSDDLSSFAGNSVTLDEIEQFRSQYAARVAAGMETGDLSSTDVSRASSCTNLQQLDADYALRCTGSRKSSYCSTCSTLSGDEDAANCDSQLEAVRPQTKPSGWRKIRNIVTWSPFVQNYKNQQYFWVQLAGHQGNFRAGPTPGTILKKVCTAEELAFKALMKDRLKPYVPDYKGQITSEEGDSYLHLQDLLSEFNKPCVMDCKMGVRTYLEDELNKARGNQKLRKDMYEKMIAVNPDEPTEDERRAGGVTKTRYMVFRETMSSTATLGFRIEGLKKSDGQSSKDFKTTKERDQIINAFREFTRGFPHTVGRYIQRLRAIKATLEVSDFFASHEVIGSSLLFVHDADKANIWLIDFAKSRVLPPGVGPISHNAPWIEGNHEDGYLIGLRNLIDIFTEMEQNPEAPPTPPPASPVGSSSPESTSAPSSASRSADSSPPTSPEVEADAPATAPAIPRAVPSLNRKDTLVAQVSEDDAQEESPPPYSVQLELRPHCLAAEAEAEATDAAEEDCAPSTVSLKGRPSPQQRLTPSLPLPIHIKKTDTVLALQTPAEAAALDRTELT